MPKILSKSDIVKVNDNMLRRARRKEYDNERTLDIPDQSKVHPYIFARSAYNPTCSPKMNGLFLFLFLFYFLKYFYMKVM